MRCLICLSKQPTRGLRPHGWQWLFTPLIWPVRCNRCLKAFYAPTLFFIPAMIRRLLTYLENEISKPKQK